MHNRQRTAPIRSFMNRRQISANPTIARHMSVRNNHGTQLYWWMCVFSSTAETVFVNNDYSHSNDRNTTRKASLNMPLPRKGIRSSENIVHDVAVHVGESMMPALELERQP